MNLISIINKIEISKKKYSVKLKDGNERRI